MPYNLIVGAIGIISLFLFFVFISLAHELKPGEDAVEPMALFIAPIAVNICYTGGWIVELLLNTVRSKGSSPVGPVLLKLGAGFSVVIAAGTVSRVVCNMDSQKYMIESPTTACT